MAEKEDLNKKLTDLISSFQQEDILDSFFDELRGLQDEEIDPHVVRDAITTYLDDAGTTIAELTNDLGEPAVNYPKVKDLADELKKRTLGIGGSRLADVCAKLCEASEAEEKETCTTVFGVVKREFSTLKASLNTISELEEAIYKKREKKIDCMSTALQLFDH